MKRLFDLTVCLTLLILLSPLILVVALLIYINLGSPVIFKQGRPGYQAKIFRMYKFRTMLNVFDKSGNPLPDEQRLTSLGRILRSISLDELPSLVNVILGDMSLVGPRPLLIEYLPLYSREQARRHQVKPGITGWAQVNGRNALSWDDKFKLDVYYVDNHNMWFDIKILFLTVKKVFFREGITGEGHVTMEKFTGSNDA